MALQVNITWTSSNPNTIWNKLAAKLGREPTITEAIDEVKRIKSEALVEMASCGQLRHQRD